MSGGKIPQNRWGFILGKMKDLSGGEHDCTEVLYRLREIKSDWELSMIKESGEVNRLMFEAIRDLGGLGKTELEMAGAAEEVSRSQGFGGRIRMRKWPWIATGS